MASSTEFSVFLGLTTTSSTLRPSIEWYCLQSESCTYSVPSQKSVGASLATFSDFSQYRGNLVGMSTTDVNEVTLQDGSSLYGSACNGDTSCDAILYYYAPNINKRQYCPIGTEMAMSLSGTANEAQSYLITPSPRVALVGDMPNTCVFVDGGYRCESGQVTLNFSYVGEGNFCDTTAEGGGCPFPRVGRTFGSCAADAPCALN